MDNRQAGDLVTLSCSLAHLGSLSVVQSPPSQLEVSSLPALERVGLFQQVALLQHRLQHSGVHQHRLIYVRCRETSVERHHPTETDKAG